MILNPVVYQTGGGGGALKIIVYVEHGSTVTASKGGVTYNATETSSGVYEIDVPEYGTYTVTASKSGQTVTDSVTLTEETVTLAYIGTLNDTSWAKIKEASDAGLGANYWSVGDCKEVTLNGTVGDLAFSNNTYNCFIIGFNHNATLEGGNRIHFQFGKTADSNKTNIAFVDSKYGTTISANGFFSMNSSATNTGGWASCQMRTNICAAFENALPSDLKAVLKSVTKYTDNTGGTTRAEANVTATTDKVFLLAEKEVTGGTTQANSYEGSKQEQYEFYSLNPSAKIKYKYNATTDVASWFLRSPTNSNNSFAIVYGSGAVSDLGANWSFAYAPAFCV